MALKLYGVDATMMTYVFALDCERKKLRGRKEGENVQ